MLQKSSGPQQKGAYIEEGDTLTMILSGVRRFAKYDASGLLQAKRTLAQAALEDEKYIFEECCGRPLLGRPHR